MRFTHLTYTLRYTTFRYHIPRGLQCCFSCLSRPVCYVMHDLNQVNLSSSFVLCRHTSYSLDFLRRPNCLESYQRGLRNTFTLEQFGFWVYLVSVEVLVFGVSMVEVILLGARHCRSYCSWCQSASRLFFFWSVGVAVIALGVGQSVQLIVWFVGQSVSIFRKF